MTNLEPYGPLDAGEQQRVIRDLRRMQDEPPPSDPRSAGCIIAIVSLITLMFMPVISKVTPLGSGALLALGVGLGLVSVVSGLLGIFGGGFVAGAVSEEVEEAIQELMIEFPGGDQDRMRTAAIRILDGSTVSTGPTTVSTFDIDEVRIRLGDAVDYVLPIERFLRSKNEIYPVFTLNEGGERPFDYYDDGEDGP
jgi:hypothetical protein